MHIDELHGGTLDALTDILCLDGRSHGKESIAIIPQHDIRGLGVSCITLLPTSALHGSGVCLMESS